MCSLTPTPDATTDHNHHLSENTRLNGGGTGGGYNSSNHHKHDDATANGSGYPGADQDTNHAAAACTAKHLYRELRGQFNTAYPAMIGMFLNKIPWLISLRFVGGIGAKELAAAALAATICNVTGMSLSIGLSGAITTLTGQARGDLLAQRDERIRAKLLRHGYCHDPRATDGVGGDAVDGPGPAATAVPVESWSLLPADKTNPIYSSNGRGNLSVQQEHDSGEPLLPLVYFYRGLFLQFLFVVPVGLWWIVGIKPVLLALGQGDELSTMTESYLRVLAPGLWAYSVGWTATAALQAIDAAEIPAYAAAVGLALHIPCNIFFIYTLNWGYTGTAVATVICQAIQPAFMLFYIYATRSGTKRYLHAVAADAIGRTKLSFRSEARLAVCSLQGILQYLGLALPGIIIISEWWASETVIFLSGRLTPSPELAIGAMTIYQSINSFCFMFPISVSIAGSTRVGNLLGAGDPRGARFAAFVNVILCGILGGLLGSIMYFTPHTFFPSLFAPHEDELINEASSTMTLLSFYVFGDGIQAAFNGIIRGCGRQVVVVPIVVIAYWVVGVPLAYYLSFVRHNGIMCDDSYTCGVVGLVSGTTAGTWCHMLLLALVVIGTTNWYIEAKNAKERLAVQALRHHVQPEEPIITLAV